MYLTILNISNLFKKNSFKQICSLWPLQYKCECVHCLWPQVAASADFVIVYLRQQEHGSHERYVWGVRNLLGLI